MSSTFGEKVDTTAALERNSAGRFAGYGAIIRSQSKRLRTPLASDVSMCWWLATAGRKPALGTKWQRRRPATLPVSCCYCHSKAERIYRIGEDGKTADFRRSNRADK